MYPIFNHDNIFYNFKDICQSWVNTPFRHLQCCKGRGVDCAGLFSAALAEAGLMAPVAYDYYDHDWYAHFKDDRIQRSILSALKTALNPGLIVVKMPPPLTPRRGDILAFRILPALTANHTAIMLDDNTLIHASYRKVELTEYDERWAQRLVHVFRIFEEVA